MSKEQQNNKTPKWLRRLEKESWQAELLISGLALYGTLQLPVFVYWLSDMLIELFQANYYFAAYAISFFYLFGISILTTFFIIHFILRAYWVGLIGLNSVYPNGYKVEDGFYSPIYSRILASNLPKIKDSIKAIDTQCSTMFSGAFVFLMLYGMMSISFSILLAIYMFTKDYIPFTVWVVFGSIFFVAVLALTIIGSLGKSDKLRNNEKLQKSFYKMSYIFGNITTPFLYKPINQILFTFTSNAKSAKSSFSVSAPFFIIATFLSMYHLNESNIDILIDKGGGEHLNLHVNSIYKTHYLDQYQIDQKIFVPVIESDVISKPLVKLFIPILRNESFIQDEICGEYEKDKSLDQNDERIIKNQFYLDCYKQYIQVKLNGNHYHAELLRHNHLQGNRRGVLSYIPSSNFSEGRNQIQVLKFKNQEQEIYEEYTINFWYTPSK